MIMAALMAGLLLAAIPNVVWIVGKIISLLAHKRLSYAPFGWTGLGLALAYMVCEHSGLSLTYDFKDNHHIFSVILKK